jgi:hypothetical protein
MEVENGWTDGVQLLFGVVPVRRPRGWKTVSINSHLGLKCMAASVAEGRAQKAFAGRQAPRKHAGMAQKWQIHQRCGR